MKVLSVVGARPQFVKLSPISSAARKLGIDHVIVHTGQHYDNRMSQSFFDALEIPEPDVNLGIGSGSHGAQTGAMMGALDPILDEHRPDWVLVYGDTNSTLAAALCAVKMHLLVAHLEAGLRSFNRHMPEEHNRILADHAADLCLAPTQVAASHLRAEGLAHRTQLVGDVMADVLLRIVQSIKTKPVMSPVSVGPIQPYVLATIHRAENTDDRNRLRSIVNALANCEHRVYLPVHPRLDLRCREFGIDLSVGSINPVDPLSYPQLVQTLTAAEAVVTDSGGLQKEAFLLRVPTSTMRTETEWTETLVDGWNVLVPDPGDLPAALARRRPSGDPGNPFGNGHAADATLEALISFEAR